MEIRGLHYGLTLLYSYLLPLFDIEDTGDGFRFEIRYNQGSCVQCYFRESTLETTCRVTGDTSSVQLNRLLGLETRPLFRQLCEVIGVDHCIGFYVTLVYAPHLRRYVAYSIYLSRNTDYYANTVKWMKQLLQTGKINASSYQVREFMENKKMIDYIIETSMSPLEEAIRLMSVRGFGVKSAKAYLLHAYGYTNNAPIDVYYARFLGLSKRPSVLKNHCIEMQLDCMHCSSNCPYKYTMMEFKTLNGVLQSILYIYGRLTSSRRSELEKILVPDPSQYIDMIEKIVEKIRR